MVKVNEVEQQAYSLEEVDKNDGQLHSLDLPLTLDNTDLNSEQKDELKKILGNNRSTFAINIKELGKTDLIITGLTQVMHVLLPSAFIAQAPKCEMRWRNRLKNC